MSKAGSRDGVTSTLTRVTGDTDMAQNRPAMSLGAAEEGMLSVAMAGDYAKLLAVVDRYNLTRESFSLDGYGEVFGQACLHRAARDGAGVDLAVDMMLLWHELVELAAAERPPAHQAYGITPTHLMRWIERASFIYDVDTYAHTVAAAAYERRAREITARALGDLTGGTADPSTVGLRLAAELGKLTVPAIADCATACAGEEKFWNARPELRHIRQAARSRRASPWGTLGYVLVQIMARVPPTYVLGPEEAKASLNLQMAAVGPSGAGKNRAEKVARAVVTFGSDTINGDEPVRMIPIGTGEGIVKNFMRFGENPATGETEMYQHTVSAISTVSEVDKLAGLKGRNGATVMANIRDGWTGETIGSGNSGDEYRIWAEEQTYRFNLIVGVQPGRGEVLLNEDEVAGGTPQRFGWFPVTDPAAPDVKPDFPGRLAWEMPAWPDGDTFTPGWHIIPVCESAEKEVDADQVARLRGEKDDAINAHALLNRLKWATALGLLNRHVGITEEDWELAGILIAVSDRTRQGIVDTLSTAAEKKNHGKGVAEAKRAIVVDDMKDEAATQSVCQAILRKVGKATGGWVTGGSLTQTVTPAKKVYIEPAVERLVSTGQIEREEIVYHGNPGYRVRSTAPKL